MFTYWCNFLPLMSSYCHLTIANLRLPLLPTFALTSHSLFLHTPITCYTFTAATTPIDGSRPFQGARLFSSAPDVSPRRDTVTALYERIKEYGFVQVRGTPASGKTVLAQLLADHTRPHCGQSSLDSWVATEGKRDWRLLSFLT
ncbi:hypothetical protein AX14_008772 [Amanita brunnescens Koide BX004]|nr:hypothetical protein AX14_008772 [Amanita brunnescens Koide BX004]